VLLRETQAFGGPIRCTASFLFHSPRCPCHVCVSCAFFASPREFKTLRALSVFFLTLLLDGRPSECPSLADLDSTKNPVGGPLLTPSCERSMISYWFPVYDFSFDGGFPGPALPLCFPNCGANDLRADQMNGGSPLRSSELSRPFPPVPPSCSQRARLL